MNTVFRLFCLIVAIEASLWAGPAFAQAAVPQASRADAAPTVQSVAFASAQGAILAGEVWRPHGAPAAAIVLVAGSSEAARMSAFARAMATRGFAVLTYDKRGSGQSGGVLPGPYNVSPANLELLIGDAAAAMSWLAAQPDLAALPLGFWGISQAGWVAPAAADRVPRTDFLATWSGTAMSVADELEDGLAHGENADDAQAVRAFIASLRADPANTDPAAAIAAFGKPSLWIYGTEDTVVPVPLALAALRPLIKAGHSEIEIRMNQGGGHDIDFSRAADRRMLGGMIDWMLARKAR